MTNVVISDISLSTRVVQLAAPVQNSRATWTQRESILIRLTDTDGISGYGEAAPLPGFSPEEGKTARSALSSFRRRLGADREIEVDENKPLVVLDEMTELLSTSSPAARFALECAVLDWLGRRLSVPAARLVAPRKAQQNVPLATLVDEPKPKSIVNHVREAMGRGIRTVKVKVGTPGRIEHELESLGVLRSTFGRDITLRLDANRSLPATSVYDYLEVFARFRPELIEEPCDLETLLRLERSPVPIALDESLQDQAVLDVLPSLFERGIVKALVLKPTLVGGIRRCLELAALAERHQRPVMVSHCYEGPLGHAGCCVAALATSGRSLAAGLDRHSVLEAWPPADHFAWLGPEIVPTEQPGLPIDGAGVWAPEAVASRR
jgi:o-succinylbenzoate synthase